MWLGSWGSLDTAIRALITNPGFTNSTGAGTVAMDGTNDEVHWSLWAGIWVGTIGRILASSGGINMGRSYKGVIPICSEFAATALQIHIGGGLAMAEGQLP